MSAIANRYHRLPDDVDDRHHSVSRYKYVLTVVDLCTRWVTFLPVKTKYPAEIITVFLVYWFIIHGLTEHILSDRGKEFMGVVTAVCNVMTMKQVFTVDQTRSIRPVNDDSTPDPSTPTASGQKVTN